MELKRYFAILRRRWAYIAAAFVGTVLLTVFLTGRLDPVYSSAARVKLERSAPSQTLVPGLNPEFGALQNVSPRPGYTEVQVALSAAVLDPVIDRLHLMKRQSLLDRVLHHQVEVRRLRDDELANPSWLAAFLQQRALNVRILPNTDIVSVTAYDTSLVGARDLANAVTDSYVEYMTGLKRLASTQGQQTLREQLPLAERQLAVKQAALRSYQEVHGVVNASEQSKAVVGRISALGDQLADAQRRLTITQQRLDELTRDVTKLREPTEVTAQVEGNPQIQNLLTRLSDLNAQLMAKLAVQTREHPEVKALEQQIDDTKNSLQSEVRRIFGIAIADLKGEIGQLTREVASENQTARLWPQREVELAKLQKEVETAQTQVLSLRSSMDVASAAQGLNLSNVAVLQRGGLPDPQNPYYPKRGLYAGIAALVGLLLGVGLAILVEYLDQSYRSAEGVQAALRLPLAGGVRRVGRVARTLHGRALAESGALELGYNAARLVEQGRKVILVTSAAQKDAKSEVAAVLATALARRGLSTVLVDLDARTPAVSQNGVVAGVSGIVFDGVAAADAAEPSAQDNLSHIPLGSRGPEVAAELDSPDLARAIRALRDAYDAVVINGPSVLPSGETVTLTPLIDAVLFVVGLNRTQAPLVLQAKRRLDDAGAPLSGLVVSTV